MLSRQGWGGSKVQRGPIAGTAIVLTQGFFIVGDVFLDGLVDLFGDPVPASRGRKGRPPHVPTAENRRFVSLSLACGHDEDAISAALRITTKTLNRHYFHELQGKHSARMRLDMKNMSALVGQVEAGSVSAMAQLDRKLERINQRDVSKKYQQRSPDPVVAPRGKKDAARVAAGQVTGKYAVPTAPTLN